MLGMMKEGVVREFCSNDAAICGLAKLNCCVNCGLAATRSALAAAARNMTVAKGEERVEIACMATMTMKPIQTAGARS